MVIVNFGTAQKCMDGYLKLTLDKSKEVIKHDWDMVFCVDGGEGAGKSVFAQQCGYYLDPSLDLGRIVFTPSDFRKAIMSAGKYQCVIYDEAYTGLSSRATMSMINRTLISMLAEIRQRNLFVFVVMPTFFDLDKYVALWRSRGLFNVYTDGNFQRGFFSFYNTDKKKWLYILGKKYYDYTKPKPNFYGRFTNTYVVDEKEYKEKKRASLMDREKLREDSDKKLELDKALFERIQGIVTLGHKVRMEIMGMPERTYWIWLRRWKDKESFE